MYLWALVNVCITLFMEILRVLYRISFQEYMFHLVHDYSLAFEISTWIVFQTYNKSLFTCNHKTSLLCES